MRLIFLGTPSASVPTLRALLAAGHDVVLVVTGPDRRRGRGSAKTPSPVKLAAEELGLVVTHDLNQVAEVSAELGIVVAYGTLIPRRLLELVDMVNVHFSLLPRWRGAAPVERAILAGDEVTGVCVMKVEVTLDTGPVYARADTDIDLKGAPALTTELSELGATLLVETLSQHPLPTASIQEGESTYASKLIASDYFLDPTLPVVQLHRIVRLGRAVANLAGKRVVVVSAHQEVDSGVQSGSVRLGEGRVSLGAADGWLVLDEIRPQGSRTMSAREYTLGLHVAAPTLMWGRVDNAVP